MLNYLNNFLKRFRKNRNVNNSSERTTINDVENFEVVESYKQLRTNIVFAMSVRNTSVVEISSSYPGEGKSITSANVAITMAQTGAKVLLIDCDLRKSVQHQIFKVKNKLGVSSILGKMATFEECVHKEVAKNLDLVSSGPIPPNPSELIASQNMKNFIEEAQKSYDYVIVDTPPIGVVSDALELSQYTGGLVIVTRQGVTTYEDVKKTINSAKFLNVNILGLVVNGMVDSKFNGYGKYNKYKKYGKYGKYGKYAYSYSKNNEN